MTGWYVALFIYVAGVIEMYYVRRRDPSPFWAVAAGLLLWPVIVVIALIFGHGIYRRNRR